MILKKDLRFRTASFAAIVLVTFAGGLLIGRAGGSKGRSGPATPEPAVAAQAAASGAGTATSPSAPGSAVAATGDTNRKPSEGAAVEKGTAKIEPVVPAPEATVAEGSAAGAMTFDPQAIHKRRARRVATPEKDDLGTTTPAPKAAAAGLKPAVRVAAVAGAPAPIKPGAAGKPAKKKSAWHDPFAD
jgi:hypothetical protein